MLIHHRGRWAASAASSNCRRAIIIDCIHTAVLFMWQHTRVLFAPCGLAQAVNLSILWNAVLLAVPLHTLGRFALGMQA